VEGSKKDLWPAGLPPLMKLHWDNKNTGWMDGVGLGMQVQRQGGEGVLVH